jgi:glutamine synthetase
MMRRVVADYLFIDGEGKFRTKNRIEVVSNQIVFGDFSTDGSSTGQASETGNTEIILRPVYSVRNHLRPIESYIVLCETYDAVTNEPLPTNSRAEAAKYFEKDDAKILFGPEQEYYLQPRSTATSYLHTSPGTHYCGIHVDPTQQMIVDKHMEICMLAGLNFYGTNAEVSQNQWEFQLGPSLGIVSADQLIVARFLLEKIAANHGYNVCFDPKPYENRHGSGCHINFSTKDTREEVAGKEVAGKEVAGKEGTGITNILALMPKFEAKHAEHIAVYGKGNHHRLTGKCETASIDKFSYGIGTRNTSMRISNKVMQEKRGYIEDRRPAANVDPYKAMMRIAQTIKEI